MPADTWAATRAGRIEGANTMTDDPTLRKLAEDVVAAWDAWDPNDNDDRISEKAMMLAVSQLDVHLATNPEPAQPDATNRQAPLDSSPDAATGARGGAATSMEEVYACQRDVARADLAAARAEAALAKTMREMETLRAAAEYAVVERQACDLAAARAEVEALRAFVRRYGCHDSTDHADVECRSLRDGPDTCDCGFDDALDAALHVGAARRAGEGDAK